MVIRTIFLSDRLGHHGLIVGSLLPGFAWFTSGDRVAGVSPGWRPRVQPVARALDRPSEVAAWVVVAARWLGLASRPGARGELPGWHHA